MRERFGNDVKRANLLVMRQVGVHCVDSGLELARRSIRSSHSRRGGNERREKAALIADQHDLLRFGQVCARVFFERLGRNVVARIQDDQDSSGGR